MLTLYTFLVSSLIEYQLAACRALFWVVFFDFSYHNSNIKPHYLRRSCPKLCCC